MKRFFALLSIVAVALSACDTTSNYAAKVNGETISTDTVLDELHTITSNPRYVDLLNQQLGGAGAGSGLQPAGDNTVNASYTSQIVLNRVLVALIEQEAAKQKVSASPAQMADAEKSVRGDLGDDALFDSLPASYRNYLVQRQALLAAVMATRDTPQAQEQYYNLHKSEFARYCVRHLLVATETQANDLRSQITGGADFAAVAREKSLDNQGQGSSASEGGALGCYDRQRLDQFVPEFRDAVLALKPNEVSQPVKTQFGYHLVEVTSFTQQSLDEARPAISQRLGNASQFLTDSLAAAKIKVNPRFGTYRPADEARQQGPAIDPPAVNAVEPKPTTTIPDPAAAFPVQ